VRVVQAALSIGFTLAELSGLLVERRRGGAPCRKVHGLAQAKLQALDVRIRQARLFRRRARAGQLPVHSRQTPRVAMRKTKMAKAIVKTDQAPKSIAGYSQAVKSQGFVFVAGQGPLM
jgi:hypothetical protein